MKSRQARHSEVQKYPLNSDDSTQKSNFEMTTQPNGNQADSDQGSDNDSKLELESIEDSEKLSEKQSDKSSSPKSKKSKNSRKSKWDDLSNFYYYFKKESITYLEVFELRITFNL